jgi:hypothetical protein
MNRIKYLIICFICLSGCFFLENVKQEYADWESLMSASGGEKDWFPPLFNNNSPFQNDIFNIVVIGNLDIYTAWGKFTYSNVSFIDFPVQANPYMHNYVMNNIDKICMRKIGFDDTKIKLYFSEEQGHWLWHYFIDTDENIVYFCNFPSTKIVGDES